MFWTILLVSVVMASNKGAWGGASGTEDEEGTVEMSQGSSSRNPPMADETTRDTTDYTNAVNENESRDVNK